ncbi:lengsin [Polyodon spathula]|uniref:lengsin n=1 Tax=Polyodon spathula TaxID=7913 RepID=UPI001B7F407B|nr:lengsin [Polyodon spathula]
MDEGEDPNLKETPDTGEDQIIGSGVSIGKRKGVKINGKRLPPTEWERVESSPPSSQSYIHRLQDNSPIGMDPLWKIYSHPQGCEQQGKENQQEATNESKERPRAPQAQREISDQWSTDTGTNRTPASDPGNSKQTLAELKSLLRESALLNTKGRESNKTGSAYTYLHVTKPDDKANEGPIRSFTTFKPHSEVPQVQRIQKPKEGVSNIPQLKHSSDLSSSYNPDVSSPKQSILRPPGGQGTCDTGSKSSQAGSNIQTDNAKDPNMNTFGMQSDVQLTSGIDHIKQQIAREDISFVRFEATDLHGVSRSKTVPSRFFQEKAIYGVTMPRSYLELTLSPQDNEVDHVSAANFNSDVLLIPDLLTFRVLPWADKTARVICDSYTITGSPLRTSPRHIAKQQLSQLRAVGFSLHSSFTYECCIFGVPEKVNSKTLFFPAATLLSNHDLPFFQQLIHGMYYMGADVDSFSSASGPGQIEISFKPEFGIISADNAFTFKTGIKEMAKKHGFFASFFTDDGFYNSGVLSHSLWDVNGKKNLLKTVPSELSEIGKKWLAGLMHHSAALSCLMAPGVSCRKHFTTEHIDTENKEAKQLIYATWGFNNNSCAFNVKCHGGKGTYIDNKLGSASANPYLALAATVAAGLDGIRRSLTIDGGTLNQKQLKNFAIPIKLEDALVALEEDHIMRDALGDPFVQYFIAMKRYEIETKELDAERNKCLEYFI